MSQNALLAGLTAGLGLLSYDQALAQTTTLQPIPLEGEEQPPAPAPAPAAQSTDGGEGAGQPVAVDVGPGTGDTGNPANTLNATTGTGRLSGDVQGTPQIINVIPKKVLEEQGVTTLDQALRNVPGVTVRIGEGGGGMNGDQFSIRGFEAKGDIYQDGLRDFGVYVRDSFLYEGVQVFKGPSSETFGVGTTGGAINTEVKKAHLGDAYHFESIFGTDPQTRGVIDINKQLGDTSAVRAVIMGNLQDIADRDHTFNDRYGALVDVATGIGTDTTWNLSYFHQHYDRMPDYGIPILTPGAGTTGDLPSNANPDNPYYSSSDPDRNYAEWAGAAADHISQHGSLGQPATEFGLDRSTFYGKEIDKDIGNVHSLTSKFQTELTDWLTVNNDTRLAY